MDRPSLDNVYQAIDTLYHNQQVAGKEDASKWLDTFQQSVRAIFFFLYAISMISIIIDCWSVEDLFVKDVQILLSLICSEILTFTLYV